MSDFRERIEKLSPKRLVLLALELQSRLEAVEKESKEPIAIVGMGCRMPGETYGVEAFWDLLATGRNTVSEAPPDRWDVSAYYDPDPDAPGRMSTKFGSFLSHVDLFDAPFFSIARREAVSMDPQQRLLLEVCWEALENAGHSPRKLVGTPTGVYLGMCTNEYQDLLLAQGEAAIDGYLASGTAPSIAAGRISYTLGLQGPSLAVDTACSASLVAIHLACQSLRTHECRMALAGGVNVMLLPEATIALSKAHMMAPDGQCKAFDARADGFVRGEGCGIVVLKRLSDAVADRDHIWAVIRGTAVNQDGRSSGLTAPNGMAQEALLRQALANAGVKGEEIGYVEAHGTGTALGDPIEAHALAAVLGPGRTKESPLVLGSVKTNVGHLEAAAGVAGLIKVVLSLQHEEIPKHLHFEKLNPHIDWGGVPVEIPAQARAWKRGERKRIAGVSSFGFSGTNVHVILEEGPEPGASVRENERPVHLLALSARTKDALAELVGRYADELQRSHAELGDICYTANAGRAHFEQRVAVVGATAAEVRENLKKSGPGTDARERNGVRPVFLFPGQGSQYPGMGKELYDTQSAFRAALDECASVLDPELGRSLQQLLWHEPADVVNQTQYTQPLLFAIEYALAQMMRSWGVEPAAVLGHSVGEYVAACVAGVYTLADGLKLMSARARLMQQVSGNGAMAAVFADRDRVMNALRGLEARVSVAAENAADAFVISGYENEVKQAAGRLSAENVRVEWLRVSHGFHSPQMQEMEAKFEDVAGALSYSDPRIELVSSVTGRTIGKHAIDAQYWRRQVRQPVLFRRAMETLSAMGHELFIEVGPGATMLGMGRQNLADQKFLWLPLLRKIRGEWKQSLESLALLYERGAEIDWEGFDRGYSRRRIPLPTYPFQRQRYWIDTAVRRPRSLDEQAATESKGHPPDDWFYKLEWEPKPLPAPVAWTPETQRQLLDDLTHRAGHLRSEHGFDRYDQLHPELDAVCAVYIANAFRSAGWNLNPGNTLTTEENAARCSIAPKHRMLFARLLGILAEDGVLLRQGDSWTAARPLSEEDPAPQIQELKSRYPEFGAEIELTARCAARLGAILQGKVDPLTLLFPEGSAELPERIYSESPGPRVFNRLVGELVSKEIQSRPEGTIRLLEVGAGTGGTTTYVVPALPRERVEYTYTDVSPAFRARAAEKFKQYPFLRYQTLDIEKDPRSQGLPEGQFDIVIAANVVHATADLSETLRHIRALLSPGGVLIFVEGTYPERWVDLTFGLTEGWWRFRDRELRPSYPLLSGQKWIDFLQASGFNNASVIQLPGGSHQAVVYARRPLPQPKWLVLSDSSGVAAEVAKQLEKLKGTVTIADSPQLVADCLRGGSYDCVLHLGSLDSPQTRDLGAGALAKSESSLMPSVLATIQAIVSQQSAAKLWLVTAGAEAVLAEDGDQNVAQAPVWGFGLTLAVEHPSVWGGLLDLDANSSAGEQAARMVSAILRNDGEDQVALRDGKRYVARLARRKAPVGAQPHFDPEKIYLITGGLGELGLLVAQWAVNNGARRLLLTGRTGLPDRSLWSTLSPDSAEGRRTAAVRDLEQLGSQVEVAAVDVCDESQMAALFANLGDKDLGGVFHLAAALDASPIKDMSEASLLSVLAPKIEGTWILHRLCESSSLDFFVMFSSWAAELGARRLGHYAAANHFLDVFAQYRSRLGVPATTISWASWEQMNAPPEISREYARGGLLPMPTGLTLAALGRSISSREPHVIVASVDWTLHKPLYEIQGPRPLLDRVSKVPPVAPQAGNLPPAPAKSQRDLLRDLSVHERPSKLAAHLTSALAAILGVDAATIDDVRSVTEFGLDSLMALELRNHIRAEFGVSIPTVRLLGGPNLRELAQSILADLPELVESKLATTNPAAAEFPLSYGQKAQWFGHKFMPDSSTFNIAFTAKSVPPISFDALQRALAKLAARHPALRTIVVDTDSGHPAQRVLPDAKLESVLIDARNWTEAELKTQVLQDFQKTFDITKSMFRFVVYRRADGDVFLFNVDHMIFDAWSLRICFDDLRKLYAAELQGTDTGLPPTKSEYRDFVAWEATLVEGAESERLWGYWKTNLGGELPLLKLPSAISRPKVLVARGECMPLVFDSSLCRDVPLVAREYKATSFAFLLSAFQLLLHGFTGQDDVIVGTSTSGRERPEWSNVIGYFVNLLPLRSRLQGDSTFADHLVRTRDVVFGALDHQQFPFPLMVERLRLRRNLERSPVFQAFFNFLTDRAGELGPLFMGNRDCTVEFGSSILRPHIIIPQQEGQSEIVLQLAEVEGQLTGNLNYNTDILDRNTAESMVRKYDRILKSVIANPTIKIEELLAEETYDPERDEMVL